MPPMEKPPRSIHIAPLGVENERISQPAIDYEADRIILLRYLPQTPPLDDIHGELTESLEDAGIEHEYQQSNFGDLFDALAAFAETIEAQRDIDDVYVNVSSGNKVAAIAGMIACMTTGRATPYYVKAEEHDSNFPQPSSGGPAQGVRSVETIPRYPMDRPKTEHLAIMRFIREQDTKMRDTDEPFAEKQDLIEYGEQVPLPFMMDLDADTHQAKYQRLRHNIITPLQELDYITIEDHGTTDRVKLTEDGRNTLRAFEYILQREL